jgi:serine/threonine protein kinase
MAPEQRDIYPSGIIDLEQCKSPSTAVDIWALGLVAWQMVAGTPAFRNGGAVFSYVARGSALPRNVGSDMFYDFATRALAPFAPLDLHVMPPENPPGYSGSRRHLTRIQLLPCRNRANRIRPPQRRRPIRPSMQDGPQPLNRRLRLLRSQCLPARRTGRLS